MLARTRAWYRESWFGQPNRSTNGRQLVVSVAVIGALVAVGWLWKADAAQEREDDRARVALIEEARLWAEFTSCTRSAEAGAELKATGLAGVQHAESTVEMMRSIVTLLDTANPDSTLVNQIGLEVDRYQDGVVEYRRVAEAYEPRRLSDCEPPIPKAD